MRNYSLDHAVVQNAEDTLAGSGEDADGTVTGYAWTQTDGPAVALTPAPPVVLKPTQRHDSMR